MLHRELSTEKSFRQLTTLFICLKLFNLAAVSLKTPLNQS